MMTPPMTLATSARQRSEVRALLVRVFLRDPMWQRFIPRAWARPLVLRTYYARALRRAHRAGRIDVIAGPDPEPIAAAVWFIPRSPNTAGAPWHLEAIVVEESARGCALGSHLLRHGLAAVDAAGAAATLEASTPGSQRLYERWGFLPVGPVPALPWSQDLKMRREAGSDAAAGIGDGA